MQKGVGLDAGTMNLVSARMSEGGTTSFRRVRNAFLDLELDALRMLKLKKVPFVQEEDRVIVMDDAALSIANFLQRELRRPLARGLISAGELQAQKILSLLISRVLSEPLVENEPCYYSVPAAPLDSPGQDVRYHTEVLRKIIASYGYKPVPFNEAQAIVFSNGEDFSGLALSYGSGMANVALVSDTLLGMSFSLTSGGGDWIDANAARALGSTASKMCAIKEAGVDLLNPVGIEQEAIATYITAMVRETIARMAKEFKQNKGSLGISGEIPLIVSGGTTRATNFLKLFQREFDAVRSTFPIKISEVRAARDPMTAVADGLLVLASQEELCYPGGKVEAMYFNLRSPAKRKLILGLREFFSRHPIYNKIASHIQDRYSWEARPQFGIVVKGSSTSNVALAADNFLGIVESYVMLGQLPRRIPCYPLEWVREDSPAVEANGGKMPTVPGVYFLEVTKVPSGASDFGEFMLDSLLRVSQEPVLRFVTGNETEATLQSTPIPATLRLFENNRYMMVPGKDYALDGKKITFLQPSFPRYTITADYYSAGPTSGPHIFQWDQSNRTLLPGVILAFGKRSEVGDKVAVVVSHRREDMAEAFGGKIEISFDLDIFATDQAQMEEITDLAQAFLWGDIRSTWADEGYEIKEVSSGGEAEESYDENAQDPYYTSSLSVSVQTDWEVHVPLPLSVAKAVPYTAELEQTSNSAHSTLPPDLVGVYQGHPLLMVTSPYSVVASSRIRERIH